VTRVISLAFGTGRADTPGMRELRSSRPTLVLAAAALFLGVLASAVAVTATVKDSTAWSALPVGWVAVWVTALVAITAYLAWSEAANVDAARP
jgi:hypothetical protein